MNIRCLLVDDEPLAVQLLQKHIAQLPFFEVAGVCSNAVQALEVLNHQTIDLLFLDIRMPQLSGLELLKNLHRPPRTILTTAYREYALDGFDLDVVDYLLKPVTFDRFFKSVERYLRMNNQPLTSVLSSSEPQFIYLKSGYKYFKVDLRHIVYVESRKDYIRVVTKEKVIVSKYRLSDLEKELEGKGFLRIHRSHVVNLLHVSAFSASELEVGETMLPIGESYKVMVEKALRHK
ncbi:LytR/AlgR family response regulator transcription factor [Puia dinghuensis]|uniref:DNA-binding response regulator n=1 Tax=Puia dinghuensis TaxID=1792502 RepID=A0A8J2UD37_9BACT|nr:LytTR family DNA-binding domain-containing protein [Puia dinghuensis]GGA98207.1 DNA-binding response regulator [Puia dinghuensis]